MTSWSIISCTASPNERHRWDERPKPWEEVVTPLNRWLSLPYVICISLVVVVLAWPNMFSNTVCSYWNSHLLATGNVHRRGALAPTHFQSCRLEMWYRHMYHSKAEKKSGGATSILRHFVFESGSKFPCLIAHNHFSPRGSDSRWVLCPTRWKTSSLSEVGAQVESVA